MKRPFFKKKERKSRKKKANLFSFTFLPRKFTWGWKHVLIGYQMVRYVGIDFNVTIYQHYTPFTITK